MTILHYTSYKWGEELPVVLAPAVHENYMGYVKCTAQRGWLNLCGAVVLKVWS